MNAKTVRFRTRNIALGVSLLALGHCVSLFAAPVVENDSRSAAAVKPFIPVTTSAVIPLVNWTAPQFFGPDGVTSSMAIALVGSAGKVNTKSDLGLSILRPITPCRLVDTRGAFNPVYGGPAFTSGEFRTYRTVGNCGVPARDASDPLNLVRVKAVSIAITTLPTVHSGDVEAVPHGVPLGNTVDMVAQAGEWNSVSAVVPVDQNGDFDLQVRFMPGDQIHLAIDINGYYGDTSNANAGDFYSIRGSYAIDGGLFYSQNASKIGAAIRAFNSDPTLGSAGGDVRLAQGANAIDIAAGQIRVRNAGNNTGTAAFIHQITAQTLCPDTRYTRLEESNVFGANASAGQILFVQEATHTGAADTSTPKLIRATFMSGGCNGAVQSSWFLFTNGAFAVGETYNVLLINP